MDQKYFIYQKSTQTLVFDITTITLEDGDEVENDFDYSGYSFLFLLKKNKTDADEDALIAKTVEIDPPAEAGGKCSATVNVTPSDTNIPAGMYYIGTRYHLDSENSYEGQGYMIEVRRAGTQVPV